MKRRQLSLSDKDLDFGLLYSRVIGCEIVAFGPVGNWADEGFYIDLDNGDTLKVGFSGDEGDIVHLTVERKG